MKDLFGVPDVDGIIEIMTRHHGIPVEAIARWRPASGADSRARR
jgi:hypothetical protein